MIGYEKQVYITEKLLFRFLMAHPLPIYKKDQEKLWSQYQKDIMRIRQDKYEKQLPPEPDSDDNVQLGSRAN